MEAYERASKMPKVAKTCEVCGKGFEVWPNRAQTAKTCSPECKGKQAAEKYEAERERRVCPICGKVFSFPKCHTERRLVCSKECRHKLDSQRGMESGPDCRSWKGGMPAHADGYLYRYVGMNGHPMAKDGRYILDHRAVMEEWMREVVPKHRFMVDVDGIAYLRTEIEVHHRNEDKRDNRKENLLACTQPAHRSIHMGNPPMEGEVWPPIQGMVPYSPYRVTCTCRQCGADFIEKRSTVARGGGKYCSRACYNERPREAFHVVPL